MQTLLPPEHFKHVVNLQPIEFKNKNSLSVKTSNKDTISGVDLTKPHVEPHREFSTFPNEVKDAN